MLLGHGWWLTSVGDGGVDGGSGVENYGRSMHSKFYIALARSTLYPAFESRVAEEPLSSRKLMLSRDERTSIRATIAIYLCVLSLRRSVTGPFHRRHRRKTRFPLTRRCRNEVNWNFGNQREINGESGILLVFSMNQWKNLQTQLPSRICT